jgi:C1A family cysteine protease
LTPPPSGCRPPLDPRAACGYARGMILRRVSTTLGSVSAHQRLTDRSEWRRIALAVAVVGIGATIGPACSSKPPATSYSASQSPRIGAPLPAGWVWPFSLATVARAFDPYTIYRPIDVSGLLALHRTGPCASVEVAPNVWIQPLCTRMPRIADSAVVPSRKSFDTGALPPSVDLRSNGYDGPVKNQGMVGVCWSFAISTLMDNGLRRSGRADVMAPLHVISSGVWEDMWANGGSQKALVREQEWPYDPVKACELQQEEDDCDQAYHVRRGAWRSDPPLVAETQRADASGSWRIATVEKLASRPADPNQIASVVAGGQAIYVGMDIDTRAFQNKNLRDGVISDYAAGESGHALVVVGYRSMGASRQFLVHNSWGTDWGDRGYAWISDAMVARFTHQAFVISVAARGAPSPATPTTAPPAPVPTVQPPALPSAWPFPIPGMSSLPGVPGGTKSPSGTCAADQARDMVFGSCVKTCPGGSPPVAGFCPPSQAGPSPAPTVPQPAGGCSAGQVRDWLTGACVAQCANGLPPAGGACLP